MWPRIRVFGSVMSVLLLCMSSCGPITIVGNTNGNDDGGANNDNGSGDPGGSDNEFLTLTVELDVTERTPYARVVAFINKGLVHRADAAPELVAWDYDTTYVNGDASPFVRRFTRGTEICLMADESVGGFNPEFDPDPTSLVPAQFVEWAGDVTASPTGASDKGVLFFTLTNNERIIARFKDMERLAVHVVGGADGTGSLVEYRLLLQAPLTIPPQQTGNFDGNIVGTILTGQSGLVEQSGFFNDGTQLMMTVPAGEAFTSWSGDGAASGRSTTVTFGEGVDVTLTFP